jgi:flavin reductase (DIM6/NTAB) family NADH-FMN oxidoreductase RutF
MPDADDEAFDHLRRRVLWSLPTGLYVVGSTAVVDGERTDNLMTASLVVQVAVEPKLFAVAVDAEAVTHALVARSGVLSLSLLAREDRALVRRFVKPVADVVRGDDGRPAEMAGQAVRVARTGAPVLAGAIAWLDGEVRHRLDLGSHTLFVAEVVDVGGPEGQGAFEVLRMEDTRMSYGG